MPKSLFPQPVNLSYLSALFKLKKKRQRRVKTKILYLSPSTEEPDTKNPAPFMERQGNESLFGSEGKPYYETSKSKERSEDVL